MNGLASQLEALGLKPAERQAPVVKRPGSGTSGKPPTSHETLLLSLPRLGSVARLEEDRGFGFISADGSEDMFFHFRGFPGRLPNGQKLPSVGSSVLYIAGSDPRRPDQPKKGVVRWAPAEIASSSLSGPPSSQESLDTARRKLLCELPREELWGLLATSWYAQSWRGDATAPVDLEDEVLEQAVMERLAGMSPTDLEADLIPTRLANSNYSFAAALSPDSPACAFARLLELLEPPQLTVLGAPDVSWIQKGTLSATSRARLLEWHLLSRSLYEPRGDWQTRFPGTMASETELATRFLAYDIMPDAFTSAWLERIARNALLSEAQAEDWSERSAALGVALFEQLSAASQASLLSTWRDDPASLENALQQESSRVRAMLTSCALAFDLETDGERIWEIGYARNGQASLLHDERSGTRLDEALAELGRRVQAAPLLVGHNILAWDWPIASRHITSDSAPLIWDTLLVQYLLEPQALSHALGGKHRADQDAAAAAELFKEQLDRLPPDIARGVLLGEFTDFSQMLDVLIETLQRAANFARETPEFLKAAGSPPNKLVLAPESRLRQADWVPDAYVVPADPTEGLAGAWRQVDVAALQKAVATGTESSPAARILVAVARRVAAQGIVLRRNMIPAWLLERDGCLASAVDAACIVPTPTDGLRVASLPARVEWWTGTDPSTYVITGYGQDVLVLDRRQVARADIVQKIGELPLKPFVRVGADGPALQWLLSDRAASVLEPRGGLNAFTTLPVADAAMVQAGDRPAPTCRPKLATRRHHVLNPGADDQGSYWAEVLRTFHEVATSGARTVPILLIVSSRSRQLLELLESGLAELGKGEVKPTHRSQREHMLRASKLGFALVDALEQWPVWQSLADSAGVVLQPVVEALPLEEWHACQETRSAGQAGVATNEAQDMEAGVAVVSGAALLEAAPASVRAWLYSWMADVGLSRSPVPALLIDPRVGHIAQRLADLADSSRLTESPLLADQAKRLALVLSPFKLLREEAPKGLEAMERFLVENWQPRSGTGGNAVTGFKESQTVAMEIISERSANVLVALPTGEGKSVLFQVPALCRGLRNRRLTLVLSPLKALMRDQVERLREQGFSVSVDYLSGDLTEYERAEVIQGVLDHRIVLLYVAPERMRSEVFLDVLHKRMKADDGLEHVVVDETHCVNQWGYEFRPDYFNALELLLRMCRGMDGDEPTPFLLLSATVTASDKVRLQAIMSETPDGMGSPLPLLARPDKFTNPLRSHIAVVPRRVRGNINDRREFDKALAERLPYIEEAVSAARRNRSATGQRSAVIVFVSSRIHAEIVAQRLAVATSGQVDYYHAGLDSGSREEIYTRFLDGDLDVLVATKAFGMGMDIPDIHWVVHLAPPGYLEDYLQEVGRIGRGASEREKAKLAKLSATLLFSDRDFESIRSMRARSAVTLPVIARLHDQVCEHAHQVAGQKLAIVPAEGYASAGGSVNRTPAQQRAAATAVRMGLYWLERAGRVRLCGSVPDLIEVVVHPSSLQRISKDSGLAGELAGLILTIESGDNMLSAALGGAISAAELSPMSGGGLLGGVTSALGRLFSGLSETVGVLLGASPPRASVRPALGAAPDNITRNIGEDSTSKIVVLNLSQMKLRSNSIKSMGDVLAILADLEKRGGVTLNRDLDIVPRKLASEPFGQIEKQFKYVDGAVAELIRRLVSSGRIEFNPFEMVEDLEGPEVDDKARRMYERSFINGFRSLARTSGIKLRQLVRVDDKVIWEAILPQSKCSNADVRRNRYLQGAQSLFKSIGERRSIPLATLVEELRAGSRDGRFHEADLSKIAGLLSAMSLVGISQDLVPLSHVVAIADADDKLQDRTEVWEELRLVNELAEARNLAMEVFANINSDAQPVFIEGYFGTSDGVAVRQFLETQLGEIVGDDTEGASTILIEMQEKLRATKAVEFFERFKNSEEPAQWEVARAPFDQHIMVNAGPGAGKTFVLVGRIAHLIREQSIDPSQIIVLAFNRAVVFEIRRRIRDLFKSLGYAAYAGRLRVSTFHSFALRSLASEGIEVSRKNMESVLSTFAKRMATDSLFAQRVAGGARCVLVDEFQDMTDDVYQVIRHIHSGTGSLAGVMVIGDDDQDILRWQRKKVGEHQFSEWYFDSFARDFGGENYKEFLLGVNFRSGHDIVKRSQWMISRFFERTTRSKRLKPSELQARAEAPEGRCEAIDWRGRSWEEAVEFAANALPELLSMEGESTAVLCRSNAEVAEAYRVLSPRVPDLSVQGTVNLNVADQRHVGLWLDVIREASERSDDALSEDLRREIFGKVAKACSVPEFSKSDSASVALDDLWELCCREHSFPHLSSLIRFVEELKIDELVRLAGSVDGASGAVVSTLHKVKGLEYDNVLILPATIAFGAGARSRFGGPGRDRLDLEGDAAEEARLFYVGMTRAKKRLIYFRGDRECSWGKSPPDSYEGRTTDGRVLVGAMEDVSLGWAMQRNDFNANPDECQRYIETEVAVGDSIMLGGRGGGAYKSFLHRGASGEWTQIGFLAKQHVAGGPNAALKVSAVVRFRPDETDATLADCVRARGWGYAVLVAGRLR